MSDSQATICKVLGWVGMLVYVSVLIAIAYRLMTTMVLPYFTHYEVSFSQNQNLSFRPTSHFSSGLIQIFGEDR